MGVWKVLCCPYNREAALCFITRMAMSYVLTLFGAGTHRKCRVLYERNSLSDSGKGSLPDQSADNGETVANSAMRSGRVRNYFVHRWVLGRQCYW